MNYMVERRRAVTNEASVFQFELNETLYFEKGQEVNEMRGVSLEPDISIHSFHDYISIRGVIELKGEYEKSRHTVFQDDLEEDVMGSKRYVEAVEQDEEGVSIFSHHFPVEISVPANRIANLNDISVYIQTFDYEIPNPTLFRLYSTIEIHGIQQEEITASDAREKESQEQLNYASPEEDKSNRGEQEADYFQFEMKQSEQDYKTEDEEMNPSLPFLTVPEQDSSDEKSRLKEMEQEETILSDEYSEKITEHLDKKGEQTDEVGRWKYKETKTLKEFFDSEQEDTSDVHEEELGEDEETEQYEQVDYDSTHETNLESEGRVTEAKSSVTDDEQEREVETNKEQNNLNVDDQGKKATEAEVTEEPNNINEMKVKQNGDENDHEALSVSPEINQTSGDRHIQDEVQDVSYLADIFSNKAENNYTSMRLCIVQEDDTIDSIAERYQVSALQLIKQNQLDDDYDVTQGQLLYIPEKKNK